MSTNTYEKARALIEETMGIYYTYDLQDVIECVKAALAQASQARTDGGAVQQRVKEMLADRKCGEPVLCNWAGCNEVWRAVMHPEAGNATQAAGALHLGFCLDADDTFHATLIRKEDDGTATVLMSNYCHIKKGRDYLMTASPAVELKKD